MRAPPRSTVYVCLPSADLLDGLPLLRPPPPHSGVRDPDRAREPSLLPVDPPTPLPRPFPSVAASLAPLFFSLYPFYTKSFFLAPSRSGALLLLPPPVHDASGPSARSPVSLDAFLHSRRRGPKVAASVVPPPPPLRAFPTLPKRSLVLAPLSGKTRKQAPAARPRLARTLSDLLPLRRPLVHGASRRPLSHCHLRGSALSAAANGSVNAVTCERPDVSGGNDRKGSRAETYGRGRRPVAPERNTPRARKAKTTGKPRRMRVSDEREAHRENTKGEG